MNIWRIGRSIGAALFLASGVIITIADYPYHLPLWHWLCLDPNGYLHEMFYLFVGFSAFVWWTMYFEKKSTGICPSCGRKLR